MNFTCQCTFQKQAIDADKLIKATGLQNLWISNFKKSLATRTISKVLARLAQNYIATHYERDKIESKIPSSFGQRSRYVLSGSLYSWELQEKNHLYEGKDKPAYGYPDCLTSAAWETYTKNPFDFTTRKDFLNTISLTCIDERKDTKMTPLYALTFDSLTTDVGPVTTVRGRKIDARHYNGNLIIPGIVYHMASKITNSLVTNHYGNQFKVSSISLLDLGIICAKLRTSKFMERIASTLR
jgi:hypothetical protein